MQAPIDTDRSSAAEAAVVLRDIVSYEDIRAVEAIQIEVWGLPGLDVVPLTQLIAARASGGVLIGAYDGKELAGFVYGFVGYEDGRPTHHSHMLAVRPKYRGLDLGYKLKLAQREKVLAQGIDRMTWTFDPLQSLNAYFNISRLGALSDRYLVDFYGPDASSFLHRTGTDRLWVNWLLASGPAVDPLDRNFADPDVEDPVALVEIAEDNSPLLTDCDIKAVGDEVAIEIPGDINRLVAEDTESAAAWRTATRSAFTEAFAAGYVAVKFVRGQRSGKYILRRNISERSI